MASVYSLTLTLPQELAEAAAVFMAEHAPQGWEESGVAEVAIPDFADQPAAGVAPDVMAPDGEPGAGPITYRTFYVDEALAGSVAAAAHARFPGAGVLRIEETEDRDWTAAWREFFTPIEAGIFEVLPPWLAAGENQGAAPGRIPLIIEPKMAFGTGHHATTALCLTAISDLHREGLLTPGQRFLDMGTGTGILGIALCKLGLSGRGLDIDPQAVTTARENVGLNGRTPEEFVLAEGSAESLDQETYPLIVANILAEPLMAMAPRLVSHLAPGGRLLLSGILDVQQAKVVAAYQAAGLGVPRVLLMGEWVCLRFEAPRA